jgi:ADP-dependent phosphofructokinase/glucokinase
MKTKAGIIAAVPSAAMLPHAVPVEVTNVEDTTGTVFTAVCVSVSTNKNSVQEKMKQSTAVAATPPTAIGNTNAPEDQETRRAVDQRRFVDLRRDVVEEAFEKQHGQRHVHEGMNKDRPV